VGALRSGISHLSIMSPQASGGTPQTPKKAFKIDWDDPYIDYSLVSERSIVGVILLEVQGVIGLPLEAWGRTSISHLRF
jgi:hypothetical protein